LGRQGRRPTNEGTPVAFVIFSAGPVTHSRLRSEFIRLSLINRFVIDAILRDGEVELVVSEPTESDTVSVRGVAQE
jgi:hypothetical protein